MNYNRRDFLQWTGSIAAGLAIAPFGDAIPASDGLINAGKKQKFIHWNLNFVPHPLDYGVVV